MLEEYSADQLNPRPNPYAEELRREKHETDDPKQPISVLPEELVRRNGREICFRSYFGPDGSDNEPRQ